MDQGLKTARMEIASEIGADVGNFTPPEEKRFTGVEIMLAIGGAMLYAFFKGMAKKVGEKAGEKVGEKIGAKIGEKIGEPLAEFVGKKIDELTRKDKASQERLLEDAHSATNQQIHTAGLTASQVMTIAQIVEIEMVKALSEKAPEDISVRIARKVSVVAVRTL